MSSQPAAGPPAGDIHRRLAGIRLYLLDMDGTFYLGDRLLPGALEFMAALRQKNLEYLFLTNNSSRDAAFYAQKISSLGFPIKKEKILTSGEATISYLQAVCPTARIYLLGTPTLEEEFRRAGLALVDEDPDLVVLGFDLTMTYHKMERACAFIRAGASFIATHPDLNCPTEEGFLPDAGAMIAFITASTGIEPKVIGKPNAEIVAAAQRKTGISPGSMAMIGDRLYTDIAIGRQSGIATILVLTGETKLSDLAASAIQPDLAASSLLEVADWIRELL